MRLPRIFIFIGAIVVLAILSLSGLLHPLGDLGRRVTLPIIQKLSAIPRSVASFAEGSDQTSRDVRIQNLQRQLAAVVIEKGKMDALQEENQQLRAQAKFLTTSGFASVGARVISRDVRANRALLFIDRGRRDHVEVGQPVVVGEGIFIGKVSALEERVSTIELLTDPNSRVAVSPLDQKRLVGVLEGRGNGATVLTYIPSSEHLTRDQILVTAGTEDKVPQNLPLGIINAVEGKTTDPFLNAAVDPLVSLDRVLLVSVLQPEALRPGL